MTRINFDDCAWTNCLCMSWTLTLARKDWFIYDPLHSSNFDFRSCTRRRSSCRSCCRGTTWTSIRDAKYIVAIVADWERGKPNWIVPPFRQGNCRLGMQLEFAIIIRLGASLPLWNETTSIHAESTHSAAQVFRNVHVHVQSEEHQTHRDEQPVAFQRQDAPQVRPQGVHLQTKGERRVGDVIFILKYGELFNTCLHMYSRPARRSVPRSLPRTRTLISWRCFPKVFCLNQRREFADLRQKIPPNYK